MRNRQFGVEIEFSSNGNGNVGVGDALTREGYGQWVGEKVESYDSYYGRYENYYSALGYDGSELELRSPILSGTDGFKQVKGVLEVLNGIGCMTTSSDGLHVHHDCPELVDNKPMLINMLRSWEQNQDHISKFITPLRANRTGAPCAIIQSSHIDNFESREESTDRNWYTNPMQRQIHNTLPRGSVNCQSLYEHGTIELRYLEGTLNWDVVESWIKFGQKFLDTVLSRKSPIPKQENPVVFLNRLKATKKTRVTLVEKAIGHGHAPSTLGAKVLV